MGTILFHPNLKLTEADRIAREQGAVLVWSGGRIRLMKARHHADAANAAVMNGDYEAALGHIKEARRQVSEGLPCESR